MSLSSAPFTRSKASASEASWDGLFSFLQGQLVPNWLL